jgi:hypothetical protein
MQMDWLVTFIGKVKSRLRLRFEGDAICLLNVLVISQRRQANLPEGCARRFAILRGVRGDQLLCERTAREYLRSKKGR